MLDVYMYASGGYLAWIQQVLTAMPFFGPGLGQYLWCRVQQHRFSYNEPMPVESCTQSLCGLALQFGEDDEDKERMVSCFPSSHFSFSTHPPADGRVVS